MFWQSTKCLVFLPSTIQANRVKRAKPSRASYQRFIECFMASIKMSFCFSVSFPFFSSSPCPFLLSLMMGALFLFYFCPLLVLSAPLKWPELERQLLHYPQPPNATRIRNTCVQNEITFGFT